MNASVKVNVVWSASKLKNLPSTNRYVTVAKFSEDAKHWPNEAWSVVLEFPVGSAQHPSFEAKGKQGSVNN
jgi:hypothetical protein